MNKLKKKLFITLSLLLVCSLLSIPVYASETVTVNSDTLSYEETCSKIEELYGIPSDIVQSLSEERFYSLANDIENKKLLSAEDKYLKIITDSNGNSIATESSYEEYLAEQNSRIGNTTQNSWMKLTTTIVESGNGRGEASVAARWLNDPIAKSYDVLGLTLNNGTFCHGTENGFYTITPNEGLSYDRDLDDFTISGRTLRADFSVASDYSGVERHLIFLQGQFFISGSNEGLTSCYAHRTTGFDSNISIDLDPSTGRFVGSGIPIGIYYEQFTGYVSILW